MYNLLIKMNVIIDKLDLPYDIKYELYNYCYNEHGYTMNEINKIKHIKKNKREKFMRLRLKMELGEWYKYNVSVYWLTGGGAYHRKHPTSCYGGGTLHESQEFRFYNSDSNYIEKKIHQGDSRRGL